MTILKPAPVSPEEALRLSHGDSNDMSPEGIDRRMEKFAQLYRFWKVTRESRLAAGAPGPYDLPPKDIRPIKLG